MNKELRIQAIKVFKSVPKKVRANLEYRMKLHSKLSESKDEQDKFLNLCKAYWPLYFVTMAWTLNPQKKEGERNLPFIIWKQQIKAVEVLQDCILGEVNNFGDVTQSDVGIEKSRKEGATEIVCKLFAFLVSVYQDSWFIVGSEKEDKVDKTGDPGTIYAKIDHAFSHLPQWFRERITIERTHLHLKVIETDSTIDGEATNLNFGAGDRATAILLDEFGRIDATIADSIEGTVHDISNCVIYSSTHWLGIGHAFNKALRKKTTKLIQLAWYNNPEKSIGLYHTPEPGVIKLKDIKYYKQRCPELLKGLRENYMFELDKTEDLLPDGIKFVADGGHNEQKSIVRSPWHDNEEERRSRRDFLSNVWMSPQGSSDSVFDATTLNHIRNEKIKAPRYTGEIFFRRDSEGRVITPYLSIGGRKRLEYWGPIKKKRPPQDHNYVIGIDPSLGTGASNSVACVYDINTKKLVGIWADPNTEPHEFADQCVALGHWVGGSNECAFLVWENNGGHGSNFGKRILWNKYPLYYHQKTEVNRKRRKKTPRVGWTSGKQTKSDLLGELNTALENGIRETDNYLKMFIYSESLLEELEGYVNPEAGGAPESSTRLDEKTGARERHGDRVIAAGLCILGSRDIKEGHTQNKTNAPPNCFGRRLEVWKRERAKKKRSQRISRW